jgi:hypothetical protein
MFGRGRRDRLAFVGVYDMAIRVCVELKVFGYGGLLDEVSVAWEIEFLAGRF